MADGGKALAEPHRRVDAIGLKCPLPALLTRRALAQMQPGEVLAVSASDPLAGIDIPNAAREAGASLIAVRRDGPVLHFLLLAGR